MAAQFAVRFALIAFAVAEIRGLMLGGDFTATETALTAGLVCLVLGFVVGELATRVVQESARREFERRLAEASGDDRSSGTAADDTE